MKIIVYTGPGALDPKHFQVVDAADAGDIIGEHILGIYPSPDLRVARQQDHIYNAVSLRIQSRFPSQGPRK